MCRSIPVTDGLLHLSLQFQAAGTSLLFLAAAALGQLDYPAPRNFPGGSSWEGVSVRATGWSRQQKERRSRGGSTYLSSVWSHHTIPRTNKQLGPRLHLDAVFHPDCKLCPPSSRQLGTCTNQQVSCSSDQRLLLFYNCHERRCISTERALRGPGAVLESRARSPAKDTMLLWKIKYHTAMYKPEYILTYTLRKTSNLV